MSLFVAIALACEPPPGFLELTWTSECLVITANSPYEPSDSGFPMQELFLGHDPRGYDLHLTNLCDEPIELIDDRCGGSTCPFDMELAAGETRELALAASRDPGQEPEEVTVLEGGEEQLLIVFNEGEFTDDCYGPWGPCGCQTATTTNLLSWLRRRR